MSSRAFRTWVLGAVLLGLAVRGPHLAVVLGSTIPRWHLHEHATDSYAAWMTVQQIRTQGLLCPHPLWPSLGMGGDAEWQRWLGPLGTFYQSPLYAYLLAAVLPESGDGSRMLVLQTALDLVTIGLVALLGRRWGSPRAGGAAALAYALAQAPVALSALMLRDSLALFLLAAALLLTEWCRASPRRAWTWVAAGALFGLAALQRENLLAAVAAALAVVALREGRRGAVLMALGLAIAISPLVGRNLAVGAPPLAFSSAGPVTLVAGLSVDPDSDPIGRRIPARLPEYLEAAQGSTVRLLGVLWAKAEGHRSDFLRMLIKKAWALTSAYEPVDNVDLDNLVFWSDPLKFSVPTGLLVAPVLLGVLAAWRLRPRTELGLAVFGLMAAVLFLPPIFWRVRAGLLPIGLPLGAAGLEALILGRGWRLWSSIVAGAGLTALAFLAPPKPLYCVRWLEPMLAAKVHLAEGEPEAALHELDGFLEQAAASCAQGNFVEPVVKAREHLLQGDVSDFETL